MKYLGKGVLLALFLLVAAPAAVGASASSRLHVVDYSQGRWIERNGQQYYYSNDKKVTGWARIGKHVYYFQKSGIMQKGWLDYQGNRYYFSYKKRAAMAKGLYKRAAGRYYYFDTATGALQKGRIAHKTPGGKRYYYGDVKTGRLYTDRWEKVDNKWYYFAKNGIQKSGWVNIGSRKYYCHSIRGKLKGWQQIEGLWYFFSDNGYILTSQWIAKGNQLCFVNEEGNVEKTLEQNTGEYKDYSKVVMVGDSRMYHTYRRYGITAENTVFVARTAQGYDWLTQWAYSSIERHIKGKRNTAIVLNLGVNDLTNVNKYVRFVNSTILKLALANDCDVYYMSVNPVNQKAFPPKGERIKTKRMNQILEFNKKLKDGLDPQVGYIDTCTYLRRRFSYEELTLFDGVHYDRMISQIIFDRCQIFLKTKKLEFVQSVDERIGA